MAINVIDYVEIHLDPVIRLCNRDDQDLNNESFIYSDFSAKMQIDSATVTINNAARDWSVILTNIGLNNVRLVLHRSIDDVISTFDGFIDGGQSNQSETTINATTESVEAEKVPFVTLSPPLANTLASPGSSVNFGGTVYVFQ